MQPFVSRATLRSDAYLVGVHEQAALRQHICVKVVVRYLVEYRTLGAEAHPVQAQPGQGTAALRIPDSWLEAYLRSIPECEAFGTTNARN